MSKNKKIAAVLDNYAHAVRGALRSTQAYRERCVLRDGSMLWDEIRRVMRRLRPSLSDERARSIWRAIHDARYFPSLAFTDFADRVDFEYLRSLVHSSANGVDCMHAFTSRHYRHVVRRYLDVVEQEARCNSIAYKYADKYIWCVGSFTYVPEGLCKMAVRARREGVKGIARFTAFLCGDDKPAKVEQLDSGRYSILSERAPTYKLSSLINFLCGPGTLFDNYVLTATKYDDVDYMTDRSRMPTAYRLAHHTKPTGELTDDFGGVFTTRLVRIPRRGKPEEVEGYAVRYVVNGEVSWGFARTKSAAQKLARAKLGKEVQEAATASTASVSLMGGFL